MFTDQRDPGDEILVQRLHPRVQPFVFVRDTPLDCVEPRVDLLTKCRQLAW